jgi:SMODS-associating 2TM, beta-strand rich effector domain
LYPREYPAQVLKVASATVGDVALGFYLLDQTALFPLLCKLPVVRSWFPDIEDDWYAELQSNWPIILERLGTHESLPTEEPLRARVTFISRLFYIRINLISEYNYSRSSTKIVNVERDPEDGLITLTYVFRNTVLKPLESDGAFHNGAAILQVTRAPSGELFMEGTYWTDRNWQVAMNTAGSITLRRPQAETM